MPIQDVFQFLDRNADAALNRLQDFLSIPSVSTDPAYRDGVQQGARWVADALAGVGLQAEIHQTAGHPIVLGHGKAKPSAGSSSPPRRALFYGHYDVQPPDPIDKWTTPPFEPAVRDAAVYARGASDDKGQVCCFIEALRAWHTVHGGFPVDVTVMIEGEEECGIVQLGPFMQQHRDELTADIALVSDTSMWETPSGPRLAITYGLRGLLYFDLKLHHTARDLHSGVYGGSLANPATLLTKVLGGLFDDQHRVAIPGFYDDVAPVSEDERRRWAELDFDESAFWESIGATGPFGESGYTTLERRWARPSCDVNGLYGGYMGEGAKTVIPTFAGAKVSFRLAPNQDADRVAEAFIKWLHSHTVGGCRWEITELGRAWPVVVPTDSPYMAAAERAGVLSSGEPPAMIREGATIPVVADFKKLLGMDTLLIGFGRTNDRIHAPDEKFDLSCLALGARTHAALLAELARVSG